MLFEQIPGLQETKAHFVQTIKQNKVAHALLFDGEMGSAALPMALAFITYFYCKNPGETDACGQCANCTKIDKLSHPDLNFVFPTEGGKKVYSELLMAEWREMILENPFSTLSDWIDFLNEKGTKIKQGNIPVEESRRIIANLSLKAYEGGFKTVLIWISEAMGISTANALLKVLEEPPGDTLFVLVSYNYQRNIQTILSRTQRMGIRNLDGAETKKFLESTHNLSSGQAEKIAFLADGNISKALKLKTENQNDVSVWFMNWLRATYAYDVKKLVPLADDYAKLSKDMQKSVLEFAQTMFREIYLYTLGTTDLMRLEGAELVFVENFSKVFKFENLEKIMSLLNESQYAIERNVSPKIVFLDLSLTLGGILR
jgi:DNA polymerase III subunit delta'